MIIKDDHLLPVWNAPDNVKAFVSTRLSSPLGPLMSEKHEPDYPERRAAWLSEWGASLQERWNWPELPCWPEQVHGVRAIPADSHYGEQADAVWTDKPGLPCTVLTADCLPVLLSHRAGTHVAVAHAGWRGLVGGVIENTVKAMGCPGNELVAWLGPAISQPSFEVGPEVHDAFIACMEEAESAFVPGKGDRWYADIYLLARQRLNRLGITDIGGGQHCTVMESETFHSYRRDGEKSGRMVSAVWIT